ncbi:hypothetical protein GC174_01425 [bacterium]|nr:hypothetical protein [bacterium]
MGAIELAMVAVLVVGLGIMAGLLLLLYKRAGAGEALIITGGSQEPSVILNGGKVVLPGIQSCRSISLELMSVELKSPHAYECKDGIQFDFDGTAEVSVDPDEDAIMKAARFFKEDDVREIRGIVYDAIQDCLKAEIARRPATGLANVESFTENTSFIISEELEKYGLKLHALRAKELRRVKDVQPKALTLHTESNAGGNGVSSMYTGHLAVVTRPVFYDADSGEITISLMGDAKRLTMKARLHQPGPPATDGVPVLVKKIDDSIALVEVWSQLHAQFPSTPN